MAWPSTGREDGRRLGEALRDGEQNALTRIWDAYAVRLYDYCHALLRDQAAAADAVHDTFIVAQWHIPGFREFDRFRGWLYAIARNECLRRREDPAWAPKDALAPEADEHALGIDTEEWTKRQETRRLVHSAVSALERGRREILDLGTRHELDADELAGVLGMTATEAEDLLEAARAQLATALTLTVGSDFSIDQLLRVLPVADIPTGLWSRIRITATARESAAERAAIGRRAEPFDAFGWPARGRVAEQESEPVPLVRPRRRRRSALLVAAAGVAAVTVGLILALMPGGGGGKNLAGGRAPIPAPGTDTPPSSGPSDPGSKAPKTAKPTHSTGSPSPTTTKSGPTSGPKQTTQPPQQPQPPGQNPPPPPPQPPHPGTAVVSGCAMQSGDSSCTVTVTAEGGPVNWTVTGTSGPVDASGSGSLSSGQTAAVTVSRHDLCLIGGGRGSVSFAPGGTAPVSWTC